MMVLTPNELMNQTDDKIEGNAELLHRENSNQQSSNYMNFSEIGVIPINEAAVAVVSSTYESEQSSANMPGIIQKAISNQSGLPYSGGMENQALRFLVEHLASFPQDTDAGYLTPDAALIKLKKISLSGGLWAQKMNMTISNEKIIMTNAETMELIEEYPVEQVSLCISILDDPGFENLVVFSTRPTKEKSGAVHIFQCRTLEVNMISDAINRSREIKAQMLNTPVRSTSAKEVPNEARKTFDLQQKHAVAQAVQAFQYNHVKEPLTPTNNGANGNGIVLTPLQDAKISRDVEILNHCIEEVERFVVMLKRINEARKQLQTKKKGSKKKKENILILQAQAPPDHRVTDIFQKFKHSLNLLAKLKPHIANPNSTELIHYLFIPLGIIVKVTGLEKARAVVDPLLTQKSIEFLSYCLDSREYHFWQTLGPYWTLTKSAPQFTSQDFKHYTPVFEDGWVPPELVINEKLEPAARATSLAVARMMSTNGADHVDRVRPTSLAIKKTEEYTVNQPQRNHSFNAHTPVQPQTIGIVVYDYHAHNNKELTIRAGERVTILDNSRRWWLVRNSHGEQGYVPSTVLEIPADFESQGSDSSSNRSTPLQSPTGFPKKVSSLDSNQNYMNGDSLAFNPKPIHSVTPVVISVQLPEGRAGGNNQQARQISIPTQVTSYQGRPQNQNATSYSVQTNQNPVFSTQQSAPPAPPPPPSAFGPPKPKSITLSREANLQYQQKQLPSPSNQPDLQKELKNRLSLHQLQDDLNTEQKSYMDSYHKVSNVQMGYDFSVDGSSEMTISDLDAVDVFIPLYKSSTADDVSRWLYKLGFSDRAIDILRGKTAQELFKINKESLVDLIGRDEGFQLYEELQVQNGAKTRHKTLTEFQKALVRRMQKREGDEKARAQNTTSEVAGSSAEKSKTNNQVSASNSPSLYEKDLMIRRQQEELDLLKKSQRNPGSATFSSFTQNKHS